MQFQVFFTVNNDVLSFRQRYCAGMAVMGMGVTTMNEAINSHTTRAYFSVCKCCIGKDIREVNLRFNSDLCMYNEV